MKATRLPSDQIKVSKKKTHGAKCLKRCFPEALRKLISYTGSKSNEEVTLKTRQLCFVNKNLKKSKIVENIPKFLFQVFRFGQTHSPENVKVAISAGKTLLFLLKIDRGSLDLENKN